MAKSRSRGGRTGGSTRGTQQRAVKSSTSTRRAAPREAAPVEIVEEGGGSGWEAGVAVATFIGLLIALLLVDKHMATYFDEGFLF